MNAPLSIPEEVLLLTLDDEKGAIPMEGSLGLALGGAVLAELLLRHRVRIDREGKKSFLRVVDHTALDDPVLQEGLQRVIDAKRRAKLEDWVSRLSKLKHLKRNVADSLCRKRVVREEEGRVLGIFARRVYPASDTRPKRAMLQRLERAIFTQTRNIEPRTIVLLALAHNAKLLSRGFPKSQIEERKERILDVIAGDAVGRAAKASIQSMEVAAMAAAVAASTH